MVSSWILKCFNFDFLFGRLFETPETLISFEMPANIRFISGKGNSISNFFSDFKSVSKFSLCFCFELIKAFASTLGISTCDYLIVYYMFSSSESMSLLAFTKLMLISLTNFFLFTTNFFSFGGSGGEFEIFLWVFNSLLICTFLFTPIDPEF